MPTDCDPWPGKTKADEVIGRSVAAESPFTRAGVCEIARKGAVRAMLGRMTHPSFVAR